MDERHKDFLHSASVTANPFMPTAKIDGWLDGRRQAHAFKIEKIPFSALDNWAFDPATGNLRHSTGRFFTIEGISVETNYGGKKQWTQPVINQPEIGILGFLTRRVKGVLYFLMQAKMEPGNINTVQLAPTLQATRSNFTRAHKGKTPPYLEYFLHQKPGVRALVDVLQSEQGARFLRKRNRNVIVEVDGDVPVLEDYCWLTLGQIQDLIRQDNVLNMDARTVLGCIPVNPLSMDQDHGEALHSIEDVLTWFTELKFRYELNVERIPLNQVKDWLRTDDSLEHKDGKFFSVIAARVAAENREVASWTQPIVRPREQGIVAFVTRRIHDRLHFLVQGKVEPGNFDVLEMAPTVQCLTGSYRDDPVDNRPPFLDFVLNAKKKDVRLSTLQSEEGGRFYQEANRNLIVEAGDDFPLEVPDQYIWMTAAQLKTFIMFNNFVNVQARCLLSGLGWK